MHEISFIRVNLMGQRTSLNSDLVELSFRFAPKVESILLMALLGLCMLESTQQN